MNLTMFLCPQCKTQQPFQDGYLICQNCQDEMKFSRQEPDIRARIGKLYSFRYCTLDGLDALDVVWNYFTNNANMSKVLEDFALLTAELKQKVNSKEVSLSKATRKLCRYWSNLMDCSIDDGEKDARVFVQELFNEVPDSLAKEN